MHPFRHRLIPLFSTLVLAGTLSAGVAAADIAFHPAERRDVATGAAPSALGVADLDGDGRPDIATGNFTGSSISILLSRPNRAFALRTDYPLTAGPTTLVAVDLDGDGFTDLVAVGWPSSTLTVLRNDGSGHFTVGAPIVLAAEPTGLAAGDWNEDGRIDLAIAHQGPGEIGLLFGDGAGGFGGETLRPVGASPNTIRSADLNGDGHDDLVFTKSGSSSLGMLLGAGNGGFSDGGTVAAGSGASDLAVGDFDGDGIPDLVVTHFLSGTLALLTGLGGGAFAAPVDRADGGVSVTATDVTGDGHLDLLVGHSSGTAMSVLGNDGLGAFPATLTIATGEAPIAVAAGDLDGDGTVDLVSADRNASAVTVTFGHRLAEFDSLREFTTGPAPLAVALGDLDGDGHLDVVTANWLGNSLSVLRGDGTGSLGPPTRLSITLPLGVQIADVDRDGHPDLVTTSANPAQVEMFPGDGAGHFGPPIVSLPGSAAGSLAVADLDGDSRPDVVLGRSDQIESGLGVGDGTFTTVDTHAMSGASAVVLARFDSDSLLDAVAAVRSTGELEIFHGFGTGGFASPQVVTLPGSPSGVAVGHFSSGSARPGVAVSMESVWGPPPVVADFDVFLFGGGFEAIAAGDLDGDGLTDVACADIENPRVAVFLNGSTGFADRLDLGTGPNCQAVAIGDLNGDGTLDVISTEFTSPTNNHVGVHLGRRPTRTTLAVTPTTLHPGGALTLDAAVTTAGGTVGSGTVTFFDRGTPLATVPVAAGRAHAVLSAPVLPTGTISAVYVGGTALRGSASDPATVRVLRTGTTAVGPTVAAAGLTIVAADPIIGRHLSLTLVGGPPAPGRLDIFDPSGRRIAGVALSAVGASSTMRIDLPADGPPGIYFVRARRGGAEARRRLAILR